MDIPSAGGSSRASNKNDCPICGQPKTAWSLKCGTCEGNRQRYLAAIAKVDEDHRFLSEVKQRGQSSVARERRVSRQAVHEMVRKAQRRIDFLTANPLPPVQITSEMAPVH
jgi:hypothetical protein